MIVRFQSLNEILNCNTYSIHYQSYIIINLFVNLMIWIVVCGQSLIYYTYGRQYVCFI